MLERFIDSPEVSFRLFRKTLIVSISGEVRHLVDRTNLDIKIINGEKHVFFDNQNSLSLAVLICVSFKNIYLPDEKYKELKVLYKDGDKNNIHPSNLIVKFPENGIDYIVPGGYIFKHIPFFSRYVIDENGCVYSVVTRKYLSYYTDGSGYYMFGVTPDVGKRTIVGMHRLLALAFLNYSSEIDNLDVNHKDGVKNNNKLSNLEWTNRKGNCDHAYSNNLRTDNIEVQVRNVFTGEVKDFYSISECARKIKIDSVTTWLRIKTGKVYYPGIQLRIKSTEPWVNISDPIKEIRNSRSPIPIILKNINNGVEQVFPNVKNASSYLGMSFSGLGMHTREMKQSKIVREHEIKYPDFEYLSKSLFSEM